MNLMWVLFIVNGVLAVTVCVYIGSLHLRLIRFKSTVSVQLRELKRDLSAFNNAAMGIGQRQVLVEKKLRVSIEKQQQMEGQQTDYLPYGQLGDLMEKGAKADFLVERFGFSEAEASLLSLLQSGRKAKEEFSETTG